MLWQPRDLSSVCPVHSDLSACSTLGYVFLNLLVQLYGDSTDRKQFSKERHKHEDPFDEEEYDFIIVGAGSAGCVVANRLSEIRNWKVLLLEAGPEQPDVTLIPSLYFTLQGSNIDWAYSTEPDGKSCLARPGGRCSWPRGRMMGGSSSINSMLYLRGHQADFDGWAALGNKGWSYKDVLPYFLKSKNNLDLHYMHHSRHTEYYGKDWILSALDPRYHSIDGELPVSLYPHNSDIQLMPVLAFIEKGLPLTDFNTYTNYGSGQAQSTQRNGIRASTNHAFIRPIRNKRKNLTIKTNSEAVRILIDTNNIAYGVEYIRKGKKYTAIARKEVIVSAGAINSPKLLMLSGIGPAEHLHDLDIEVIKDAAVGENLHDHVNFEGLIVALPNVTNTAVTNGELLSKIYEYREMEELTGPLTEIGPLISLAFGKTNPNLVATDVQYTMGNLFRWREYFKDTAEYSSVNIFPTVFYDGLQPRVTLETPRSRGRLFLNATDPYGPPMIHANYYGDPVDLATIVKATRFLYDLENTNAFKLSGAQFVKEPIRHCEKYKWGTDAYSRCLAMYYTSSPYHPVGTCKMGPKWDRKAVVDPHLRVIGVKNLRVIDASIMPVVTRAHTNAPSIMIGEKGADLVKEDWLKTGHRDLRN